MSTRSCIKIVDEGQEFFLYRHHDGYPSVNGLDLLEVVEKYSGRGQVASVVASDLVRVQSKTSVFGGKEKAYYNYEMTDSWHGDIDWAYEVHFEQGEEAKIFVATGGNIQRKESMRTASLKVCATSFMEFGINSFNEFCRKKSTSGVKSV